MTKADEPARRRKPLRRTAWGMLIGGLVGLGLMVGTGLLLLAGGQDIGPGRPAVWPAGERASVHKHPGPKDNQPPKCQLIGPDVHPMDDRVDWADSARSSTDATIRCEGEAIFLTGTPSAVVSALQSPLITAPVAMAMIGAMLFFPRLFYTMARMSNGRGIPTDVWLDRRR